MRALLINPWIHDFAAYGLWSKPLGLLKIASYLKRLNIEVRLLDCLDRFNPRLEEFLRGELPRSTIYGSGSYYNQVLERPRAFESIPRKFKRYGLPKELFVELLNEEPQPDIILVTSGMTYWYPGVFEAIEELRQRFGSVPIILGGIYTRLCPEHARDYSKADFIYDGYNISEILSLISKLTETDFDYSVIEKDKEIFFAYELYQRFYYLTLRTSSGCPFRCSYCGWHILEDGFRQEDPDFVVSQIEYFYKNYHIENFSFYDDALLYNAQGHIVRILNSLIKKKIKASFHTPNGLHARFITPEIAKLLKACGFIYPRLGLETVSKNRQIESGAKTTSEEFLRAVMFLKEAGFRLGEIAVNIMIGLPGHDYEEVRESIEFVASQGLRIFLEEYSPVPGTAEYLKSGLPLNADPLLHNNSVYPLYKSEDYARFQELKNLAHRYVHGQ